MFEADILFLCSSPFVDYFSDISVKFWKQEKKEELAPLQIEFERMRETCKSQSRVIKRKMREMENMQEHMVIIPSNSIYFYISIRILVYVCCFSKSYSRILIDMVHSCQRETIARIRHEEEEERDRLKRQIADLTQRLEKERVINHNALTAFTQVAGRDSLTKIREIMAKKRKAEADAKVNLPKSTFNHNFS